jgi:hypothetical protein
MQKRPLEKSGGLFSPLFPCLGLGSSRNESTHRPFVATASIVPERPRSTLVLGSRASRAFVEESEVMENEREKSRDQNEGSGQQQPIGEQNDNEAQRQAGQGSEPPRSTGRSGTEFGQASEPGESGQQGQSGTGQADLGTQADTTLAGRADQQDLGQDQPGSFAGGLSGRQSEPQGEGFVGSEGEDSGEYLQQGGNPESGFAEQGRGASNQSGDIERENERSENRESDIEGSSGGNI